MRAIGFTQGQRGDLIISTVPARAFKQMYPDGSLTLGLNKQYADMAPLFVNHESYDDVHIYDAYDNWPSPLDESYLKRAKYDIIFDAMPKRANEATWWQKEHQCQNACSLYNLPYPKDGIQCRLTKWFDVPDYSGHIALNYIGAFYAGYPNAKSYSPERARELVKMIRAKGYKVIVLGDPKEPALEDTERKPLSYLDSVKTLLGCRALVGIDSGLTWLASAYSHPTLACYSDHYYRTGSPNFADSSTPAYAIQPVNPKAQYLSAPNLNDISIEAISTALDSIL